MLQLEKQSLQIGFIPLLDCVALLWADHRGFFKDEGLEVELVREASWASLRDRLAYGFVDAAHCLSAMLPAAAIGNDQLGIPLKTPLVLSQNRAFITLSQKLCFDLGIQPNDDPQVLAEKVVLQNNHQTQPLKLAHVFHHSIHHYCLREWLALADVNFASNIQLSILPPPVMTEALIRQKVDGFCVGEPWNTEAEIMGTGHRILSSQNIIPPIADKVLAVTAEWGEKHPNTLNALCNAVKKAQQELRSLKEYDDVWKMLVDYKIIRFECSNTVHVQKYHDIQSIIRNFVDDDVEPKASDFKWLIQQMKKWDQIEMDDASVDAFSQNCILDLNRV